MRRGSLLERILCTLERTPEPVFTAELAELLGVEVRLVTVATQSGKRHRRLAAEPPGPASRGRAGRPPLRWRVVNRQLSIPAPPQNEVTRSAAHGL